MKKKRKKSQRRIILDRCFKLHSSLVRERSNWTCERCHKKYEKGSQGLHCSHVFSRAAAHTAFLPDNAFALCFNCHLYWWHSNPIEAAEWAESKLGQDTLDTLRREYHTPTKLEIEKLREVEENLKGSLSAMNEERYENGRQGRIEFDSPYERF